METGTNPHGAMAKRPRDRVRIAAWSATAVIGVSLSLAAVTYRPDPDIQVELDGARFMLSMGLASDAEVKLRQVLARDPENGDAQLLLGNIGFRAGRYDEALSHYVQATQHVLSQDDPQLMGDLFVSIGALRLHKGQFEEAQQAAELASEKAPERAAGPLIWAFSRLGRGDEEGFRYGLTRAFELSPFDPFFRIQREFITEAIPWATAFVICDWPGRVPRP